MASVTGNRVFQAFIANANAEYRKAGLSEYQMRVRGDGSVDVPNRPATVRAMAAGPAANPAQVGPTGATSGATAGAAAQGTAGTPQAAAAQAAPTAAGPSVGDPKIDGTDGVRMAWKAVPGATSYGIYQDGKLIGSVPQPSFGLRLAANVTSVIEIDAVLANGQRTKRSNAVAMRRQGEATVQAKALAPGALEAAAAQAQQAQQGAQSAQGAAPASGAAAAPAAR